MKIALLGPDPRFKGGIGQYNHFLAEEILRQGHGLLFVGFERQYPAFLYPPGTGDTTKASAHKPSSDLLPPQGEGYDGTAITYTVERLLSWDRPFSWRAAARHIETFAPDVVVVPWWTFFWYPWFAPLLDRLAHIPRVVIAHNAADHEQQGLRGHLSRWAAARIFRRADRIIVQSEAEKERVTRMGGREIVVVHHPVYPHFASSTDRTDARKHLNIPQEATVILLFGAIRPYKGADLFADAVAQVSSDIIGIIAGEIWDKNLGAYLRGKAADATNLILLDRYFDHAEGALVFAAADAVAQPYRSVPGSGAAMAALGAGKPLIASDLPLFREILPLSITAFFPAGDRRGLADAMRRQASLPKNKLQSDAARNMILTHFGWDRLVQAVTGARDSATERHETKDPHS